MGWRNRPTFKNKWSEDIDVILFIDENGDSSMKSIEKSIRKGEVIQQNNRYFTTSACVIRRSEFISMRDKIVKLKENHWNEGLFNYGNKLKRVCFHSHEIRGRKGPFCSQTINNGLFLNDLSEYMTSLEIDIFSSTLDKEMHFKKYLTPDNPYNLCMNFILERFTKFYLKPDEKAMIILEARGKKEDKKLLDHIKKILDEGTNYVSSSDFKKIKGVYFNTKWCKEDNERKSYFGLEIVDLVSYPIHKYNIKGEKDKAFESIENKIYGYPNYIGRGIKKFPVK